MGKEFGMLDNPYRSPSGASGKPPPKARRGRFMSRLERWLVVAHLIGLLVYLPCFFAAASQFQGSPPAPAWLTALFTVHFSMTLLGLAVIVVIIRDLYLRDYFTANEKLTWGLLFFPFSPSIYVYFFRHAWKPRDSRGPAEPDEGRSLA